MMPRRNPVYPGAAMAALRHVGGLQWLRRHGTKAYMKLMTLGLLKVAPIAYYEALQRPNTELVTDSVERLTADGVVAGGRERPADVIIYGPASARRTSSRRSS